MLRLILITFFVQFVYPFDHPDLTLEVKLHYWNHSRSSTTARPSIADKLDANSLGSFRRVVGGLHAAEHQFPFIVSIRYMNNHVCGGAIIAPKWIITASHCFFPNEDFARDGLVIVGTNYLHSGGDVYRIRGVIQHKNYDRQSYRNDIALVLTEEITFNENVQPIEIYPYSVPDRTIVTVIGWGDEYFNGNLSESLKYTNLTIINHEVCEKVLGMKVVNTLMCGLPSINEGSCNGDSGGPIISGRFLVGLSIWGLHCASNNPETFTKLNLYTKWIQIHKKVYG